MNPSKLRHALETVPGTPPTTTPSSDGLDAMIEAVQTYLKHGTLDELPDRLLKRCLDRRRDDQVHRAAQG